MGKATYDDDLRKVADLMILTRPDVSPGKMFGYPAYYAKGKMFACVYENGLGIKVPADRARDLLVRPDIDHFVPMGRRVMKEWIMIRPEKPDNLMDDARILVESVEFVLSLVK
jgi:hypothetical protein